VATPAARSQRVVQASRRSVRAGVDAEAAELLPQRLARDAEELRDARLVPVRLAQRAQEVLALELALRRLERLERARHHAAALLAAAHPAAHLLREVLEIDVAAARQNQRVADGVLQLAHVAREAVVRQRGPRA